MPDFLELAQWLDDKIGLWGAVALAVILGFLFESVPTVVEGLEAAV